MKPFKNLIFDLGEVIIDLDYPTVIHRFQQIAAVDFSQIISYSQQHRIFDLFETGKITSAQFCSQLLPLLKPETTPQQITDAWNSVLLHYPPQKIELLQQLKKNYSVFALSNINAIHVDSINRAARQLFQAENFASFFHRAYYSNEVGMRKPDKEIYQLVLKAENINPHETFFVDDKLENVLAAKELGIAAYQLTQREHLHTLLTELRII